MSDIDMRELLSNAGKIILIQDDALLLGSLEGRSKKHVRDRTGC